MSSNPSLVSRFCVMRSFFSQISGSMSLDPFAVGRDQLFLDSDRSFLFWCRSLRFLLSQIVPADSETSRLTALIVLG